MPRYAYRCSACDAQLTLFHLADEEVGPCPVCEECGALVKVLSAFTTPLKTKHKGKVGEVTERFIDDARQDLKKQKQSWGIEE